MSKRSAAKRARRNKRQAARDRTWIPAPVREQIAEELEIASELEDFDAQLTARGWAFSEDFDDSDDSDDSDDVGVAWYWPPSMAEVEDDAEQVAATVVLLTPDDGGEIAHVVFVGTSVDYQFGLEELFDHLDVIEAYRVGAPPPLFS
ncbi:MAG: hypothetical protein K0U70_07925 [Actinomycetia bacterium]|nr:hypothetical protein [Actinomycetes bacterium]MCH9710580.1 hypothetical protein [Actinomycetes bacterium]MCH9767710.1 hypothetical protein [Actinomycetes bacterium]